MRARRRQPDADESLGVPAQPRNIGSLQINCGQIGPDGVADCTCAINHFNPITIPSLGDLCVYPAGGCGTGAIDCDGGTAFDTEMAANHDIGSCASNAGCALDCSTYCGGLGGTVITSSCEGHCLGGSNDDMACVADSECPGATCVGTVNHAGTCNCACQVTGLGAPAAAGNLSCPLGIRLDLELPPPASAATRRPSSSRRAADR
jgi:hypothetical protein